MLLTPKPSGSTAALWENVDSDIRRAVGDFARISTGEANEPRDLCRVPGLEEDAPPLAVMGEALKAIAGAVSISGSNLDSLIVPTAERQRCRQDVEEGEGSKNGGHETGVIDAF